MVSQCGKKRKIAHTVWKATQISIQQTADSVSDDPPVLFVSILCIQQTVNEPCTCLNLVNPSLPAAPRRQRRHRRMSRRGVRYSVAYWMLKRRIESPRRFRRVHVRRRIWHMVPLPLARRPRRFAHMSPLVWSLDLRQADIECDELLFACLPHQPAVQHRAFSHSSSTADRQQWR